MEVADMQRQLIEYTSSLFNEGYLDNQFTQLQQLQDESNPGFVMEVITLFFEDTERLLLDLSSAFDQQAVDFQKVDAHVHQLKGSSSSCQACLQQVNQEYFLVKSKLQMLFTMEQQIVSAGGSIPLME